MNGISRTLLWTVAAVLICFILAWGIRRYRTQSKEPETDSMQAGVQAVANPGGDWPQFHGDQAQSGVVPGNLPEQMSLAWRFAAGSKIKSSPAIVDGRVYIGASNSRVYSLDVQTGEQIWAKALDDAVEASPTLVEGTVYIGTIAGTLYALDAGSGDVRWTFQTGDKLVGGTNWFTNSGDRLRILAGSYDAYLYCIDASSGQTVWTYQAGSYINGSPAVTDDYCMFGSCDAIIHVLSIVDASNVRDIDTGAYIAGSAVVRKGHVYAANYDGDLLKASLTTGEVLWRYSIGGEPSVATPAVTDEVVVIGGDDMRVHCVDSETGNARWTFAALDAVDSSPAIAGDKVIVGSDDGRLYLLRLTDGEPVWSYEAGQSITSSPAVADGMVVVGCNDGTVYCFK